MVCGPSRQPNATHAIYGGEQASISIEDLSVLNGRLSPRALGLVMEWATIHQSELGWPGDLDVAPDRLYAEVAETANTRTSG